MGKEINNANADVDVDVDVDVGKNAKGLGRERGGVLSPVLSRFFSTSASH